MKYLIAIALSALLTTSALANVVITSGGKSGSYYKVANNLKKLIGGGEVMTSRGSIENLKRLVSGEAQVGIAQMDAIAWYSGTNPDVNNELEILGPLYDECVYIAAKKGGKVRSEDDLQKSGTTIAIGKQGSGSAVTWDYMRQLEKGYKKSAVEFSGGSRALGKVALDTEGGIDAVMWVTKPKLDGKYAQTVLKNDNLVFIDVNDKDLNDKYPPTGKPIYKFKTIETQKGFFNDQEVKTICTEAVLVARQDVDEDTLDQIADIVLNYKTSLIK